MIDIAEAPQPNIRFDFEANARFWVNFAAMHLDINASPLATNLDPASRILRIPPLAGVSLCIFAASGRLKVTVTNLTVNHLEPFSRFRHL